LLVLRLILSVFGIGFFCWLIFTLIVYALPFVVGLTAGMAAFHGGAGVIGALVVGVAVGALTLLVGQVAFASARPLILRAAIGLLYAVPAAIAGYHAVLGLSQIGVPPLPWREAFACIGAIFIGGTAWARICRCSSHRSSGRALATVRLSRCRRCARPGTSEAPRRRSVADRLDQRLLA
jgi:hypothetical protein